MKRKSLLLTAVTLMCITTATMGQNIPSYVPINGLEGWWPFNGNGTNSSGFSGLPGGRTAGAKFLNVGYESFFWSSTPMGNDGFVYGLSLSYNDNKTYIDIDEKNVPIHDKPMFIGNYISNYNYIRCVKD
jgi:uncharacterized protein (TIGR02145 family)